ncbi:trp operon leader peptide [Streptomyces sp. NPDC014006]
MESIGTCQRADGDRNPGGASGRVPGMFAQLVQNWWWTASPAAH